MGNTEKRQRKKRRKKNEKWGNKLSIIMVAFIAVSIAVVLSIKVNSLKEQERAYKERIENLEKQYAAEQERAQELEEYRIYVQTKQYIEKVAKEKLGLVKPDEIILKPNE